MTSGIALYQIASPHIEHDMIPRYLRLTRQLPAYHAEYGSGLVSSFVEGL